MTRKKSKKQKIHELLNIRKDNLKVLKQQKSDNNTDMEQDYQSDSSASIKTENRFNVLKDNVTEPLKNVRANKNKNYSTPIVAQGPTYENILKIMTDLSISKFQLKITSIGIKINIFSEQDKEKLKNKLLDLDIEHFTFCGISNRPLKVIITGLPNEFSTDDVKDGIVANGIKSDDIQKIQPIHDKDNKNNIKYHIVHFNKQNVSFRTVQSMKDINHVIIRIFPYRNTKSYPTQCRRCQMFGHGTSHCFRKLKCVKCGGSHDSLGCFVTDDGIKCANCEGKHPANDKNCPKLQQFKLIKNNININRQIKSIRSAPDVNKSSEINTTKMAFPPLPIQNNSSDRERWNKIYKENQQQKSTWVTERTQLTSPQANFNNNDSPLFSLSEITMLVSDIVQSLAGCKTKIEQFTVITELSIKYLYSNGR